VTIHWAELVGARIDDWLARGFGLAVPLGANA